MRRISIKFSKIADVRIEFLNRDLEQEFSQELIHLLPNKSAELMLSNCKFYVYYSIVQLLHASETISNELFSQVFKILCQRIIGENKRPIDQWTEVEWSGIPDLVYETIICLYLKERLPDISFGTIAKSRPDIEVTLNFHGFQQRVQFECKNIKESGNESNFVKKVVDRISSAYVQFAKRADAEQSSLFVFIDLPYEIAEWNNLKHQKLFSDIYQCVQEQCKELEWHRVIFTSFFHNEIGSKLKNGECKLHFFKPTAVSEQSLDPASLVLLAAFFNQPGSANILSYQKTIMALSDQSRPLSDHP